MKFSKTLNAAAGFSVKAADRNANVSVRQSLQGEVASFIRPTDTVGKNRQALGTESLSCTDLKKGLFV